MVFVGFEFLGARSTMEIGADQEMRKVVCDSVIIMIGSNR